MESISADEVRQMVANHETDRIRKLADEVRALSYPRWEYMITGSLSSLAPMGQEGWELVALWEKSIPDHPREPNPGEPYLIWKRRT